MTAVPIIPLKRVQDNSNVSSRLLSRTSHPDCQLLREASLIILEELPMANISTVEAIDELLKSVMNSEQPFGGKNILGIGDFRQVAPVVPGAYSEASTLQASFKSSHLWPLFTIHTLTAPIRSASDPEYCALVDMIGEGYFIPLINLEHYLQHFTDVDSALHFVFPDDILQNPIACLDRAFLTPTNAVVDDFNGRVLERLHADQRQSPHCTLRILY